SGRGATRATRPRRRRPASARQGRGRRAGPAQGRLEGDQPPGREEGGAAAGGRVVAHLRRGPLTMKTPEGSGAGKVRLDLAQRPPRMDLIGRKGATLFCTYRLDKGRLLLCWWPKADDRQDTMDPEKQDPPGVLMVMERPKESGPVLDARL